MHHFIVVRTRIVALVLCIMGIGPSLEAQITAAEFSTRRDSLAARVGEGIVLAFGGRTPVTDYGTFFQLPAFHYLTGYDEPDAAFVMVVRGGRGASTLFVTRSIHVARFTTGFDPIPPRLRGR